MYKYSNRSKSKLATCHPDLIRLFEEAIKYVDISIIGGGRTLAEQEEHVRAGRSKTMKSKHLIQDDGYSYAVDAMAYPIEWENWQKNYMFVGFIRGLAATMGIKIRVGADWDGDWTTKDQSFHDLPHVELVK